MKKINSKVEVFKQIPEKRIHNFNEVSLGYTEEQVLDEASRCLNCKNPLCVKGCPVEIDIPAFIAKINEKDFLGAIYKIKEKNSLPAICGRVCPQENQCEKECILSKKNKAINIGNLERFVADWEIKNVPNLTAGNKMIKNLQNGAKRVAVIGSGPAGLTCAADLSKFGYKVTIFEALHKGGGVLFYGIPEFRLPKAIVRKEIDYIKHLGVDIKLNHVIGKLFSLDDLFEQGYEAIFLGIGAGLPVFLNIPGENFNGVYSANEFLTRANLMEAYLFPERGTPIKIGKRTAVIGGGNVAMDSARVALRLGAKHVYVIYRRSLEEMPARREEIENAQEEGIDIKFLTIPVKIICDEEGRVKEIECIKAELGAVDKSGRRSPVPIKGSEFKLEVDQIVIAVGTKANPLLTATVPDLELNKYGYIVVDENTGKTSKQRVWAGGDIVTGSATVIEAMGAGKKTAVSINEYIKK